MRDSSPATTFVQAADALSRFGLAYLHTVEQLGADQSRSRIAPDMRLAFDGPLILNGGYDAVTGAAALRAGEAEMIAYGRHFLANPDLVNRIRLGAPLTQADARTFYTEGPEGYTDYT
jgi:N-ethylmaleimide reductase